MSNAISDPTDEVTIPVPPPSERPPARRRRLLVIGVIVLVVVGTVAGWVVVTSPFSSAGGPNGGVADNAALIFDGHRRPTFADVADPGGCHPGLRGQLQRGEPGPGHGHLPARVGQVISQGQVLYDVNGSPVVLLYGATPAYRTLAEGDSPSDVTGRRRRQSSTPTWWPWAM